MTDEEQLTLAQAVAKNLGDEWFGSLKPLAYGKVLTIERGDGAALEIFDNRGGRLVVNGRYPPTRNRLMPQGAPRPITLSVLKAPWEIARDIRRRLLPQYLQALLVTQKQAREETEWDQRRERTIKKLNEALKERPDRPILGQDRAKTGTSFAWDELGQERPSTAYVDVGVGQAGTDGHLNLLYAPIPLLEHLLRDIRAYFDARPQQGEKGGEEGLTESQKGRDDVTSLT